MLSIRICELSQTGSSAPECDLGVRFILAKLEKDEGDQRSISLEFVNSEITCFARTISANDGRLTLFARHIAVSTVSQFQESQYYV
jgi:hypothetical protein